MNNEEDKKIILTPTNTTLAAIALVNFVGIAFFAGTLHEAATYLKTEVAKWDGEIVSLNKEVVSLHKEILAQNEKILSLQHGR